MRLVLVFLLLAHSIMAMASGQTVTAAELVKLVADPANPKANDLFVAIDVQNDRNIPINVSKEQFVVLDKQGNTYETSDIPFAGMGAWGLPVGSSVWAELPQRVNPGVAITPLVFFSVPPQVKVADLRLCMDKSCQDLGPVECAIAAAQLHSYRERVMQVLLSHWTEPTNVPVGEVTHLSVNVGPDGNLYGATVTQPSGNPSLDQSCMQSIEQTKQVETPPDQTAIVFYFRCFVTASHPYSFALDDAPGTQAGSAQAVDPTASPNAARIYHTSITTPPRLLYAPAPQFPAALSGTLPTGWQALVVVGLLVDAEGTPQQVHVVRAFGRGFDEKAVEAVKKYRFSPAIVDGKPVPLEVNVEVNFKVL
jgi:TonB family protein